MHTGGHYSEAAEEEEEGEGDTVTIKGRFKSEKAPKFMV